MTSNSELVGKLITLLGTDYRMMARESNENKGSTVITEKCVPHSLSAEENTRLDACKDSVQTADGESIF